MRCKIRSASRQRTGGGAGRGLLHARAGKPFDTQFGQCFQLCLVLDTAGNDHDAVTAGEVAYPLEEFLVVPVLIDPVHKAGIDLQIMQAQTGQPPKLALVVAEVLDAGAAPEFLEHPAKVLQDVEIAESPILWHLHPQATAQLGVLAQQVHQLVAVRPLRNRLDAQVDRQVARARLQHLERVTHDRQIERAGQVEAHRGGDEIACLQPPAIGLGLHAHDGFLVQCRASGASHGIEDQLEAVMGERLAENIAPVADIGSRLGGGRGIADMPGIYALALGHGQCAVRAGEKLA